MMFPPEKCRGRVDDVPAREAVAVCVSRVRDDDRDVAVREEEVAELSVGCGAVEEVGRVGDATGEGVVGVGGDRGGRDEREDGREGEDEGCGRWPGVVLPRRQGLTCGAESGHGLGFSVGAVLAAWSRGSAGAALLIPHYSSGWGARPAVR